MERYSSCRDIIKTIRISKYKSLSLNIHIVYVRYYPGYRIKIENLGDKDYNEIFFGLTFNKKIERMRICFGIIDDRSLPF